MSSIPTFMHFKENRGLVEIKMRERERERW